MTANMNITPTSPESLSEAPAQPCLSSLLARWQAELDTIGRLTVECDRAGRPRQLEIDAESSACADRRIDLEGQIAATRTTDRADIAAKLEIALGNARYQLNPSEELGDEWLFVESALADLLAAPQSA